MSGSVAVGVTVTGEPKTGETLAEESARIAAEKAAAEKKDAPAIEFISKIWHRFGELRERSGASIKDAREAVGFSCITNDDKRYREMELGKHIDAGTSLPFGSILRHEVDRLIKLADLFDCSLDYLLCRTDDPEPAKAENVPNLGTGWQTVEPTSRGDYAVIVKFPYDVHIKRFYWDGRQWLMFGVEYDPEIDGKIVGWILMPEGACDD